MKQLTSSFETLDSSRGFEVVLAEVDEENGERQCGNKHPGIDNASNQHTACDEQ